jgi:hypothetical protein
MGLEKMARLVSYPFRGSAGTAHLVFAVGPVQARGHHHRRAALDVDNEKDFMVLSVMYRVWLNLIRQRVHDLA